MKHGYAHHQQVLRESELSPLRLLPVSDRTLLEHATVRELARDPRLRAIVGADAFAVRAILFDKDPSANWALGWHQDSSIAVRERFEVDGFGPWTVKDGVPHAIAPASLLSEMVSLRVHLDACGVESGPLRVIPDSHLHGRLTDAQVRDSSASHAAVVCLAGAGDVLAFRPLLLHASSSSSSAAHRRVLQLEYARSELPGGLAWRWRF